MFIMINNKDESRLDIANGGVKNKEIHWLKISMKILHMLRKVFPYAGYHMQVSKIWMH